MVTAAETILHRKSGGSVFCPRAFAALDSSVVQNRLLLRDSPIPRQRDLGSRHDVDTRSPDPISIGISASLPQRCSSLVERRVWQQIEVHTGGTWGLSQISIGYIQEDTFVAEDSTYQNGDTPRVTATATSADQATAGGWRQETGDENNQG